MINKAYVYRGSIVKPENLIEVLDKPLTEKELKKLIVKNNYGEGIYLHTFKKGKAPGRFRFSVNSQDTATYNGAPTQPGYPVQFYGEDSKPDPFMQQLITQLLGDFKNEFNDLKSRVMALELELKTMDFDDEPEEEKETDTFGKMAQYAELAKSLGIFNGAGAAPGAAPGAPGAGQGGNPFSDFLNTKSWI